jgi:DNA-binding MarR family transcriptional regulator
MPSGNLTTRPPIVSLLAGARERAHEVFQERLAKRGYGEIRPGHGCVFRFIDRDGTRLTVLAERSGLSKQAVGEVVDDLVGLEHVERVSDPQDGRAKIIRLTERGERAHAAGVAIFEEIESEWAERYGPDRVAGMRELLEEILEVGVRS